MSEPREAAHREIATAEPRMTALSDHPMLPDKGWIDRFNFPFQLGAIYDILRHRDTQTPLTVGIYGDWGSGKTSAMRWLEGLLEIWDSRATGSSHVRAIPVWFYPWKYQTREDVWRGIVAEIVLKTMAPMHPRSVGILDVILIHDGEDKDSRCASTLGYVT